MKKTKMRREDRPSQGRRRFLGLLGAGAAAGLVTTVEPHPHRGTKELDLREADFYRRLDLAG